MKKMTILAMAIAATLCVTTAEAAPRHLTVNASGACQSALPVFDVQIRKRPLAVQNEGDKAAFVTCAYYSVGPYGLTLGVDAVRVYAATNNGIASTLTCTGVNGYNDGFAHYAVKQIALPADGSQVLLAWNPDDFSNPPGPTFPYSSFNLSCNLNPGVGINQTEIHYHDNDIIL